MKMTTQKQIELEDYLFTNFGLTKIYLHHLEHINKICQKAEKDYIFANEEKHECQNGCQDCECKESIDKSELPF